MTEMTSAVGRAALFEDPAAYCSKYYSFEKGSEESEHEILKQRLQIFDELYKTANLSSARILEMGGGPTICSLISAVRLAESITFTDGSEKNVEFLQKWKRGGSDSYDFSSLIGHTVSEIEGNASESAVSERQDEIRSKMESIKKVDLTDETSYDTLLQGQKFDVLSTHYCLLHAVKTLDDYSPCLKNLARLLKPNGLLILSEMLGCFHAQRHIEREGGSKEHSHDHQHEHKQKDTSDDKHGQSETRHSHEHHGNEKEHNHSHGHEHGHSHQTKTKKFIMDSVENAGFDILKYRLITRDSPLLDVPGAQDASVWTTVVILARKRS